MSAVMLPKHPKPEAAILEAAIRIAASCFLRDRLKICPTNKKPLSLQRRGVGVRFSSKSD